MRLHKAGKIIETSLVVQGQRWSVAMEELRRLLMRCAEESERSQKLCEEADLLIMKARILRARMKANMKKREQAKRSGDQR